MTGEKDKNTVKIAKYRCVFEYLKNINFWEVRYVA